MAGFLVLLLLFFRSVLTTADSFDANSLHIDSSTEIECDPDFPKWDSALPPGYTKEDYGTLKTLCGRSKTNPHLPTLGGRCSFNNDPPAVIFRQTYMHEVFRGMMGNQRGRALQYYCAAKCNCQGRRKKQDSRKNGMVELSRHLVVDLSEGGVRLIFIGVEGNAERVNVLAPFDASNARQKTSLSTVDLRKTEYSPPSNRHSQPVCGGSCRHASDCHGSGRASEGSCSCVVSTSRDRLVLGVEKTLWVAAFCFFGAQGPKRLNGRMMLPRTPCVCNATFVSDACCGSADGVVLGYNILKRGELDLS